MVRRCLEKGAEVADRRWRWDRSKRFDASLMMEGLLSNWRVILSSFAMMLLGISLYRGRIDLEAYQMGALFLAAGALVIVIVLAVTAKDSRVDKECDSCDL